MCRQRMLEWANACCNGPPQADHLHRLGDVQVWCAGAGARAGVLWGVPSSPPRGHPVDIEFGSERGAHHSMRRPLCAASRCPRPTVTPGPLADRASPARRSVSPTPRNFNFSVILRLAPRPPAGGRAPAPTWPPSHRSVWSGTLSADRDSVPGARLATRRCPSNLGPPRLSAPTSNRAMGLRLAWLFQVLSLHSGSGCPGPGPAQTFGSRWVRRPSVLTAAARCRQAQLYSTYGTRYLLRTPTRPCRMMMLGNCTIPVSNLAKWSCCTLRMQPGTAKPT